MRILGLAAVFRRLAWRVCLVVPDHATVSDLARLADCVYSVNAAPYVGGPFTTFDVEPFGAALGRVLDELDPEVVIAEYAWMAPTLDRVPPAVARWVDCHDLLHERTRRFSAAGLDPWVQCTRAEEVSLLRYADTLIATQRREAEILSRMLPGRQVHCFIPPVQLPVSFKRYSVKSPVVISVGADHAGNNGIREFADAGWSRVIASHPRARLKIVGGISRHIPKRDSVFPIEGAYDVYEYYRSAAVVVCPITTGTGVKVKMVEALRFGKAVVCTRIAAEGLPQPSEPAWVTANTIREAADAVSHLLHSPAQRAALESRAFAYGRRYLSQASAVKSLQSILDGNEQKPGARGASAGDPVLKTARNARVAYLGLGGGNNE